MGSCHSNSVIPIVDPFMRAKKVNRYIGLFREQFLEWPRDVLGIIEEYCFFLVIFFKDSTIVLDGEITEIIMNLPMTHSNIIMLPSFRAPGAIFQFPSYDPKVLGYCEASMVRMGLMRWPFSAVYLSLGALVTPSTAHTVLTSWEEEDCSCTPKKNMPRL